MSVVMMSHFISLEDLYPYFQKKRSTEICVRSFYHCQRRMPLLYLEDLSFANKNNIDNIDNINILLGFSTKKISFHYDDFVVFDRLESIINEMYYKRAKSINLLCAFEEKDSDGITTTQWEIINKFYVYSNNILIEIIKDNEFRLDFIIAFQRYYYEKTDQITSILNIDFDGHITPIANVSPEHPSHLNP